MLDNLREDAASSTFIEETPGAVPRAARRAGSGFLGMTPPQRFILTLLLMAAVCVLGTMCLMVTGKIGLLF